MNINPNALLFWALAAAAGWLIAGVTGAVVGFGIAGTLSLLVGGR